MKITKEIPDEIWTKFKNCYPIMLDDIQKTLQINEDNYKEGSEFSLENGYGFHIYFITTLRDYFELGLSISLFNASFLETEDKIYEEDNSYYIRQLFLSSDDSGYVIYIKL